MSFSLQKSENECKVVFAPNFIDFLAFHASMGNSDFGEWLIYSFIQFFPIMESNKKFSRHFCVLYLENDEEIERSDDNNHNAGKGV